MKKIEMEFLKDFNDSLESRKTFKNIRDEINIERFKKEPKKQIKLSFAKLGFVGVCLLLLAIIIPTTIFLFNTPKVVGLTITNKDDLVIEYQRNCNFINKGIMVDKKMSDGSTVRANEEEIIIDYNTFDNNNSGRYYISVYLKNKPEVETGYYVSVSKDEISNIELIDYRDTYYVGETIIPEDLIIKKNLSSGKVVGTKYTEYSIDTSNFNGNKAGKYDVNVVLNSNNDFAFSYQVEVKQLEELDINGRYGYIDSYYKDNAPTILVLEINDNVATPYYSEIIVGETPAQTLIKEVVDGKIVIKDDKHSQKMIYKPFTNEMIIDGLMVGEPDMKLFKLDEDDYVISLNGEIADKNTFYIAKDGYLSEETISYLFNTYGGIYIDEEMEIPVTEETFFSNDSIVIVGSKNDGIDEKIYLGTFYDSKNRIALVIEEDFLYSYSNTTPISYVAQLKDNGDVWIRTSPYDPTFRYISNEDKFEIYSGDNYYTGDLYRYNPETQVTITVNRNIGTSPYKFVLNKGEKFNCINIERNQLKFFKIPGYNETPIYEDTTFNNVTISNIYMSDFSYDIFGSHDNYFIIRSSWSVGKDLIDGKTTYWYEIYENYDAVELGWIEFSGYKDRTIYFTLHNEDGSYKTISYNRDEKCYTIENIMFSLNETPFKDFDFVGKYIGSDGTEKTISDKGMLGTIRYTTVGNQVIDYEYIYIDTLEEDSVTLWYTYQTIEDKLEIKKIQLIKKDFGWSFEIDGVTYTQEIHEHTWGEYQYNESEHWRTYTCGHTAPNNNTSHIDDNDDGNCDICNYKIPESHTHTWTWYIEDIGHIKTFTCGCPSEEGTSPHFDNDNNNLCDACGYLIEKDTPTGTFKLNIIDNQNFIYDKPGDQMSMFAPGTTILLHALPIMDADLVMYVNDVYYSKQSIIEINSEYVWEYSFVMPGYETTIKFEIETLENDENDNDVVRTKISMFGAPSLPYYMSLEVGKEHDLTDENDIITNVYLGHAIHIYRDIIYFPDTTIYREDIKKYSFVLKVNYDNNVREKVTTEEEIAYLDYSYIVETEDLYDGETYKGTITTYKKYHSITLNKNNFVKDYGFVNVELYIVDLDGNESIVVSETLYYSVVDNKVVFGLVSNPHANEGDKGIVTEGWTYEN